MKRFGLAPYHTCFVTGADTVRCWGANEQGQLGRGGTSEAEVDRVALSPDAHAVLAAGGGVLDLALGQAHSCALLGDGTVACWGGNDSGQLGRGTITEQELMPETVPALGGVVQLVAGLDHTCARRSDGAVACFGANDSAQLGRGAAGEPGAVAPGVIGVENASEIAAGRFHTCALQAAGTVACWAT